MNHAEEIINKIKKEDIRPIPRWKVNLKRMGFWAACIFAILFGAIAFSVILYAFQEAEYNLLDDGGNSRLQLILAFIPLIWVFFLVLFLMLSIFGFRQAPKGYKYNLRKRIGIALATSLLLGSILFLAGGGKFVEKAFEESIESYRGVSQRKMEVWSRPEEGYLSGRIDKTGPARLEMTDFVGKSWTVTYTDAFVAGRVRLKRGEEVKFLGNMVDQHTFKASEIRPWGRGKGKRRQQGRRKEHRGNGRN